MEITKEELKSLATELATEIIHEVHEQKHDFWIDGKQHYDEHQKLLPLTPEDVLALKEAATNFRAVRGNMLRVAFWFVLLGSSILAVLAMLGKIKLVS